MTLPIRVRPEARQELLDACAWYENVRPGLGAELKNCVYEAIDNIREWPRAHPRLFGSVRSASVCRFRFKVVYEVLPTHIEIYALFHTSRDPRLVKRLLRRRR